MSVTRFITAMLMVFLNLFNYVFNDYAYPAVSMSGAYVFCYFTGNEVDEQKIHLAVSRRNIKRPNAVRYKKCKTLLSLTFSAITIP